MCICDISEQSLARDAGYSAGDCRTGTVNSPQVEETWIVCFFFKNRRTALNDIFIRISFLYLGAIAGMVLENCNSAEIPCAQYLLPFHSSRLDPSEHSKYY